MDSPQLSIDEMMFSIEYQLCKEFPAWTPVAVECEKYHKIIDVYADVRKFHIRAKKSEKRKIRKPAGDNWF